MSLLKFPQRFPRCGCGRSLYCSQREDWLTPEFQQYASEKSLEQLRAWAGLLQFCTPMIKKQVLVAMQSAYFLGRNDQIDCQIKANNEMIQELAQSLCFPKESLQ